MALHDAPHIGQADAIAGEFRSAVQTLEHAEQFTRVLHARKRKERIEFPERVDLNRSNFA